jgi:hypothetical protein
MPLALSAGFLFSLPSTSAWHCIHVSMDILRSEAGNYIGHAVLPLFNIHPSYLLVLVSPDGLVTAAEYT